MVNYALKVEKNEKNIVIKIVLDWLAGVTWEIITLVLKILNDIISGRMLDFWFNMVLKNIHIVWKTLGLVVLISGSWFHMDWEEDVAW